MNRIAIITRCGQCYHAHYDDVVAKWVCLETMKRLPANVTDYSPYCAPPDWCPLVLAADVARVKPLKWTGEHGHTAFFDDLGNAYWTDGKQWSAPGEWAEHCDSLEAGKAACEAHYRAALFAEHGPLVQIEVPK